MKKQSRAWSLLLADSITVLDVPHLELKATAQAQSTSAEQSQLADPTAYLFSRKIVKFPLKETHLLNIKLISWEQATENHFR